MSLLHLKYAENVEKSIALARRALTEEWFPEEFRDEFEIHMRLLEEALRRFDDKGDEASFNALKEAGAEWDKANHRMIDQVRNKKKD